MVGASKLPISLNASGHVARFVGQMIDNLPATFTGVLEISSATPIAALTLRSLVNERNEFLLTTFPIADQAQPGPEPIVFPQIADGGGYSTEFIMLSSGGASSMTINLFDSTGMPLVIGR